MSTSTTITEAEILEKVVASGAHFSREAARSLLQLKFDRQTNGRIRQLLRKNNRGTISTEERNALEKYLRVGQFLDLVHAKARLLLKEKGESR